MIDNEIRDAVRRFLEPGAHRPSVTVQHSRTAYRLDPKYLVPFVAQELSIDTEVARNRIKDFLRWAGAREYPVVIDRSSEIRPGPSAPNQGYVLWVIEGSALEATPES